MDTSSVASGIQTFLGASQRVQESANTIARNSVNGSPADMVEPLVDLKVAEQQAGAAARIIEVESAQVGTLLDLLV